MSTILYKLSFFVCALEYGGGSNFWCYVGTNAELVCVEFYNFVQRSHICKLLLLLNRIQLFSGGKITAQF
jgi:hypothetical protein